MKLENQVCTPQQAKKLKELGIIQKSLFYYHPSFDRPVFGETWTTESGKSYKKVLVCNDKKGSSSAFTVSELFMLLPTYEESHCAAHHYWYCGHVENDDDFICNGNSQAEVVANRLISLIESERVIIEESNKRLVL